MNSPNVVLTGVMGTGKSTVGKILAANLGFRFRDTDQLIEDQQGKKITQIFAEQGEEFFRNLEKTIAKELARQNSQVIATGGGFMLAPENCETFSQNTYIFCLEASPTELVKRLLRLDTKNQRPLLQTPDPESEIIKLMQERSEKYSQFQKINTDNKTPDQIAHEIMGLITPL